MGKHEVDFDDYEERTGGYDGETPKKGLYTGTLIEFGDHESSSGNEGLVWVFEISEGEYKGWRGWVYSNLDSTKWKTQQVVKAINGGSEEKVVLDTSEKGVAKILKNASPVRLRIVNELYEGESKGRIKTVMPAETDEDAPETKKKKGKKGKDAEPWD